MRLLLSLTLIIACSVAATAQTYWPSETDIVTPTARGLAITTQTGAPATQIPFGTGFQDSMHQLIGILGWDVDVGFPQECGAGPLVSADWPDAITLMFENDRFAGWFLGAGDRLITDTGLLANAPLSSLTAPGTATLYDSTWGQSSKAPAFTGF